MPDQLPISVVVPAYNAAAYLSEALESIAAQRCSPTETIVVDDGSTDAGADIARSYGVRVITQENRGLSGARNAGIAAATQPWIAFLDADDRWHPERLAAQWTAHGLLPDVGILASDYTTFREGTIIQASVLLHTPGYVRLPRERLDATCVLIRRDALAQTLVLGNFVLPSSWLVARALFVNAGVLFAPREELPAGPDFHVGEDYEWFLRALRHSDVGFVERPLVEYRRSAAALSADGARLRLGDVMLGDAVRRCPQRYVAGAAQGFAHVRALQLRDVGQRYCAVGNIVAAQAAFARAGADGDGLAASLAWLTRPFTWRLGRTLFAVAWAMWRRCVRPLVHRARRSG